MQGMRVDARELPLHMQEQVAISFLSQLKPQGSGHLDDRNILEMEYKNGQRKRTEEVISLMMEVRTQVEGAQHKLLTELVYRIKSL